jgi:hypothetical protein
MGGAQNTDDASNKHTREIKRQVRCPQDSTARSEEFMKCTFFRVKNSVWSTGKNKENQSRTGPNQND